MAVKRKKNIKFLSIYNTFSEKEKKEFRKFIRQVISGNNRNYLKVLSSLNTNEDGIAELSITSSKRTRWNRLSELSVIAEKFLIFKSLNENSPENSYKLLMEYNKRNLPLLFRQEYKKYHKNISNKPAVNYNYNLTLQIDKLNIEQLSSESDSKNSELIFSKSENFRTGVYLIELLENLIDKWTQQSNGILISDKMNEEVFASLDFEKILEHFQKNLKAGDKIYHILKFLYLIYKGLDNPNDSSNYLKARQIFFRDLKSVSKEKREDYYIFMKCLLVNNINMAVSGSLEEMFFLINKKLKEGLIEDIENKNLTINNFRDYVFIAVNLGKYRWTNSFINKYGSLLPEEIREDYILISQAFISHKTKNYSKCLEQLSKIKRKDHFFYIDVSVLKMKTLYDSGSYNECHDELKKINEYLRKDRVISKFLRTYAKEFCNCFSKLLKLRQYPVNNNLINLEFRLSKNNMIGKKWIISKISEIKI